VCVCVCVCVCVLLLQRMVRWCVGCAQAREAEASRAAEASAKLQQSELREKARRAEEEAQKRWLEHAKRWEVADAAARHEAEALRETLQAETAQARLAEADARMQAEEVSAAPRVAMP
jgi:hypothetical protein